MDDLVKRADEILEGVTPGPWEVIADESAGQVKGFPTVDSKLYQIIGSEGFYGNYEDDWTNARFIASARELVPAMRERIVDLEWEIDELDFLRHEGRPDSVAALEAKFARAEARIAELDRLLENARQIERNVQKVREHEYQKRVAAEARIAELEGERDEALRRRDAWKARAENHVEILNALRAKTDGRDSRTLSRALLGAAFTHA